jgi:hypothetical protein
MQATKATEQSQDSRSHYTKLDKRYGKIGISAVAAAIRHRSQQPIRPETRQTPFDSD